MRLFIALDIADEIRERLTRFMDGVRNFAPDARWVHPESLHVTLKFIGEQPESHVEQIQHTLESVNSAACDIHFTGYGFFPTPKSARVFCIGMQAGPELSALASDIDDQMPALGIEKETRVFSPHLTLARGAGRSGAPQRRRGDRANSTFQRLQEKLASLPAPEFGTMTAREFYLYQSQLSPKGSKYTKLAAFGLK
jgi:RNA 2',3'-cyclic 3'-phosphodiesterase